MRCSICCLSADGVPEMSIACFSHLMALPKSPDSAHAAARVSAEMGGFVLTSVLTRACFGLACGRFAYEKRRGRESNPRKAGLQTPALPPRYPPPFASDQ